MKSAENSPERVIGLFGATSIGVAAIIGGGILALAGAAFSSAGPSAILAIALNGAIALVTAMSFAELSTAFPQSGGAYVFANKVLSIRAAFGVGWVLWFAYIVACVLYALGFAAFAILLLEEVFAGLGSSPPDWLASHTTMVLLSAAATAYYMLMLIRHVSGGGNWINIAKMVIFALLIIAGAFVFLLSHPIEQSTARLSPYFSGGITGLVHAMGITFVVLHGFEVIAAVAGEVKNPDKVIPRAMFLSVGLSLLVYIPLLFFASTVGVPSGVSLAEFSAQHGDTVIAAAVREYMGPIGYWLVIAVAILAFLSALRANLMAGSRIVLSMALDRTLPSELGRVDPKRKTPIMAIYATGLGVVVVLLVVPNLEAAGAAASLIFLLSFALVHATAYLARKRVQPGALTYQTPWFPLIPALGVISCTLLGVFEAIAVPDAGRITIMWLAFGGILYFALFRSHAEMADASVQGLDPSLARLRGKDPLIVVPIANPANAHALVEVANALAPSEFARVLLLSIVPPPSDQADDPLAGLLDAQKVVAEALGTSLTAGFSPDALISISGDPWGQIRRVARFHECESLLIGLGQVPSAQGTLSPALEDLINDIDCDVAIMRIPEGWRLEQAKRIIVPIGGKGEEHMLRARILGSLCRTGARDIHFVSVVGTQSTEAQCEDVRTQVTRLALIHSTGTPSVEIIRDDDPVAALSRAAAEADLIVLGLGSIGGRRKVTSRVSLAVASETTCASLLLSSKRQLGYSDLYKPLRGVFGAIGAPASDPSPADR